ncbi:hypothetical protein L2E82_49373 [Cichorium intybus]|uniref:Uncharacterized protein n=1 Tax=Cichorium intybus TaxID=13427 RepID=A0ACB8YZI7_CICIN|nr:hypothetical protein L2E82_49373 [Cichorium intybus]
MSGDEHQNNLDKGLMSNLAGYAAGAAFKNQQHSGGHSQQTWWRVPSSAWWRVPSSRWIPPSRGYPPAGYTPSGGGYPPQQGYPPQGYPPAGYPGHSAPYGSGEIYGIQEVSSASARRSYVFLSIWSIEEASKFPMKFTSTGDGDKEVVVLLPHISYTSNRCQSSIIQMTEVPKDLTVGTIGGAAQLIVGHPFDTINVKLQSQSADSRAPLKVNDNSFRVYYFTLEVVTYLFLDGFLAGDMDKKNVVIWQIIDVANIRCQRGRLERIETTNLPLPGITKNPTSRTSLISFSSNP